VLTQFRIACAFSSPFSISNPEDRVLFSARTFMCLVRAQRRVSRSQPRNLQSRPFWRNRPVKLQSHFQQVVLECQNRETHELALLRILAPTLDLRGLTLQTQFRNQKFPELWVLERHALGDKAYISRSSKEIYMTFYAKIRSTRNSDFGHRFRSKNAQGQNGRAPCRLFVES
jgi:hypothetical protein